MRVAFHTLGCKVNHYETEAIREAFVSRGAISVDENEFADVYIINTCTVTNIADRKSRQFIRRAKRVNPDALIVVTGCYAQVESEEVAALPEVDMVIGNGQKSKICELVIEKLADKDHLRRPAVNAECSGEASAPEEESDPEKADRMPCGMLEGKERECKSQESAEILVLPRNELTEYEDMGLVASSEPGMTRAYIKIQEGCDRFCAYCLIPYARGPVRSRPPQDILKEAAMLVDAGHRELVLTGINTALYGTEPGFCCNITDENGSALAGLEHIAARLYASQPSASTADASQRAGGASSGSAAHTAPAAEPDPHGSAANTAPAAEPDPHGSAAHTAPAAEPDLHGSAAHTAPAAEPLPRALKATSADLARASIAPIEIILALLDAMPGDFRIRLSSLEPTVVDKNDVEKIIRYRRLCHHLHLSVQNGSDKILRSMNRRYTRNEYLDIVKAIREYDPLYGITTDIIVGFPGETADDFADTLDITERSGFGKVHVFRYSPRKGTAGAALPGAVSGQVKIDRSDKLEETAAEVANTFMKKNIGKVHRLLTEEIHDGYMTGYTGNYIRCYVKDSENRLRPGEFCDVILTELFRDGCKAELCKNNNTSISKNQQHR